MAKEKAKEKPKERSGEVVPVHPLVPVSARDRDFDRFVDRMFEDFRHFSWPSVLRSEHLWSTSPWRPQMPAVDVYEEKDSVVVKADLPGLTKDDLEVSLTGSTLTLKGEKKKEEEIHEPDYYRCERSYGTFIRTVTLPAEVKAEEVKASFKNGVLEVRLPKAQGVKQKQIKVEVR